MTTKLFVNHFSFPTEEDEYGFLKSNFHLNSYHSSPYPFRIFPQKGLKGIEFSQITVLCGDNGSGKSTILNLLARRLGINHQSLYNDSVYMDAFLNFCHYDYDDKHRPRMSKIITSDDVFQRSFNRREMNRVTHDLQMQIYEEGRGLMDERLRIDFDDPKSVAHYERQRIAMGRGHGDYSGPHKLVMKEVGRDIVLNSNGENALEYFANEIQPNGLYLLDEPENSLSIKRQIILKQYIEQMSEEDGCQFIIASHSPCLIALENAAVYNLDAEPAAKVMSWTNIENMREYYHFFKHYETVFENPIDEPKCNNDDDESNDVDTTKRYRNLMAHHGYDWQYAEAILKELRYPNRIEEFILWTQEYQQIYANLFPNKEEIESCVNYICWEQERPKLKK